MFTNLDFYGGDVVLVTITAPGVEGGLPWDEEYCAGRHTRGGAHSGKRGCRVEQQAASEWTATASWRWGGLRRAAAVATRRHAPVPVNLLERVWEPQKRGVAHLHLVLGAGTPAELDAAAVFVSELKRLAAGWNFGFADARGRMKRSGDPRTHNGRLVIVRGEALKLISPEDAARYLSSYLTGRNKHKATMRQNLLDPAMTALSGSDRHHSLPLVWLTPRLTSLNKHGTGCTMRTLRRARHFWAWKVRGLCETGPNWRDLEEAVIIGAVFRRVFSKRGEASEPPPLEQAEFREARELARYVQAQVDALPPSGFRMQQRDGLYEFANQLASSMAGLETETPRGLLAVAA